MSAKKTPAVHYLDLAVTGVATACGKHTHGPKRAELHTWEGAKVTCGNCLRRLKERAERTRRRGV